MILAFVQHFLATQERLMAMSIDTFSPAHWPVQRGPDVGEFLRESRNYCQLVERRLLEFAARGPFTLRAAVETLGPGLGDWPAETNQDFSYGMLGNLHFLAQRGLLKTIRDANQFVVWEKA